MIMTIRTYVTISMIGDIALSWKDDIMFIVGDVASWKDNWPHIICDCYVSVVGDSGFDDDVC